MDLITVRENVTITFDCDVASAHRVSRNLRLAIRNAVASFAACSESIATIATEHESVGYSDGPNTRNTEIDAETA